MKYPIILLFTIFYTDVNCKPTIDNSLVLKVINDENITNYNLARLKRESSEYKPEIKSLHIKSDITLRYANTTITSNIKNAAETTKEVTFSVILPDTAFISGFIMKLDDKEYEAYVKEKKEAKKIYDEAVFAGQTAAHIATETRDSNHFTVSINLESAKKAEFKLKYEELLTRKNGMYQMEININPGQLIDDMAVDVNIDEVNPLSFVIVPLLSSGNEVEDVDNTKKTDNPFTTTSISEDRHSATVHFAPSKAEQTELMSIFKEKQKKSNDRDEQNLDNNSGSGVSGQFVVQYDVELEANGQVLVNSGYFVHFFTPETLKPLNKYVLFVLDLSGSMYGQKLEQLKNAMKSILDQLKPEDTFNLITFSYHESVYNLSTNEANVPTKVTPENIAEAKVIIDKMVADGGTNMESGLAAAFKLINFNEETEKSTAVTEASTNKQSNIPMIIFLSDGEANMGKTGDSLITYTKQSNKKRTPIFSLAFGNDADRDFMKKLSLKNSAFMRPIYDAADASKQLKNFFKTISSPLLTDVQYEYPKDQTEEATITETKFHHYFSGSSMIIAGKLKNDLPTTGNFTGFNVVGHSRDGFVNFHPIIIKRENKVFPMERIWAYLTIKQLMDERERNEDKKDEINEKALNIALKYKFVTPVTSLVVVKPNSTDSITDPVQPNTGRHPTGYSGRFASSWVGSGFSSQAAPASGFLMPRIGIPLIVGGGMIHSPNMVGQRFLTTTQRVMLVSPRFIYGLQDFRWIEQYLNNDSKSITLPLGTETKTLLLKYHNESKNFTNSTLCDNAINDESGECKYLTDCPDINQGFKSLSDYINHYCEIEGYAGLCCRKTS